MEKVNNWLATIPSKATRKNYLAGIRKFEKFLQKPIESLIGSSNAGEIIEKYYSWLKDQGHPQNTRRNLCNVPIQFLKFHKTPVDYSKHLGIYRTVVTTKDHLVRIEEVQAMAQVANLKEQILLEIFILGLRIGDASRLEWRTFDVKGEPPIPITIQCGKEETVAQTFISEEFQQLLEKYLPQLDKSNPYLFHSARQEHLSEKQIDRVLKSLVKRASVQNHGSFRWHTGRKLVLRTCAELGINQWSAKMLVGKSVSPDIATYIQGAQLRNDFIKLNNILRLFPKHPVVNGQARAMLDTVFQVLRALVEEKLREQGMLKRVKAIDWNEIYQKVLPENERKEKVQID
jgi:site-specific recombinase XerD